MTGAEDPQQQRLFAEAPGRVTPPEPGLYLGTSGWSYEDWDGTLYPEGTPAASRLAEYANHYATVEIDSTFYGTPRRSTVDKWREIVPTGFLFAAKFPQRCEEHKPPLVLLRKTVGASPHFQKFPRPR